jgi:hypothetical protein
MVAAEQNPEKRADFTRRIGQYSPQQLVFIDESGRWNQSCIRYNGRSPRAVRAQTQKPAKPSGGKINYLAAIDCNRVLDLHLWYSNTDEGMFTYALEQAVIPHLNAYPGPCSVVIMDNASFHTVTAKQKILNVGARVEMLPPYSLGKNLLNQTNISLDYNPIESLFSFVKLFLQRNNTLALKYPIHSIIRASQSVTSDKIHGWFRNCGYFIQ